MRWMWMVSFAKRVAEVKDRGEDNKLGAMYKKRREGRMDKEGLSHAQYGRGSGGEV